MVEAGGAATEISGENETLVRITEGSEGVGVKRPAIVLTRVQVCERRPKIGEAEDSAAGAGRIKYVANAEGVAGLEGRNAADGKSVKKRSRDAGKVPGELQVIVKACDKSVRNIVRRQAAGDSAIEQIKRVVNKVRVRDRLRKGVRGLE